MGSWELQEKGLALNIGLFTSLRDRICKMGNTHEALKFYDVVLRKESGLILSLMEYQLLPIAMTTWRVVVLLQ